MSPWPGKCFSQGPFPRNGGQEGVGIHLDFHSLHLVNTSYVAGTMSRWAVVTQALP